MEQTQDDFTIAKVDGRWIRYARTEDVPEGATPVKKADVEAMSIEEVAAAYSEIAGVDVKKFSSPEVAIASLYYQIAKMLVRDPNAPTLSTPKELKRTGIASTVAGAVPRAKISGMLEVLVPADLDKALSGLAPQARELVSMLADIAKAENSLSFPATVLADVLSRPEAATRLRTTQPPSRIWSYYRSELEKRGLLRSYVN